MKRFKVLLGGLLFSILIMANAVFSQSASEYKAKIEAINKDNAMNMVQGNFEKGLSRYTADAISMPSNEPMEMGIDAIRKANEESVKSGWKCNSFDQAVLKVLPSGNLITEIGTYKINMLVPGMDKPVDDHGKYLTIWEKQKDGSLKVKVETWNSDVAPMGSMSSMNNPETGKNK